MKLNKINLQKPLFWSCEDQRGLEVWHETNIPNWGGRFRRVFNGEFKSFKTLSALQSDVTRLIEKFDMFRADSDFARWLDQSTMKRNVIIIP